MTVAVLFISLFVFLLIGVPIAISLGASALITIYFTTTLPLTIMTQKAFTSLDSFPLLAVPFFMLAGVLMGKGGVSKRLLNLATILVGWMIGGLAMVTIVSCMFFAAISGSGPATVAAIGSFMIPSMKEKKYEEGFAAGVAAAAGSIGVIIPPSIPFVLYGVVAGVSVGSMFLAGIIPGIILGIGMMIVSYMVSKKKNYKSEDTIKYSFKEGLRAFYDAKWALLIPVIILGGIYGGVFSPTEAAVVAVVYAIIIGAFVHKELSMKDIYDCLREAIVINATTMIIIGLSISFAYIMTLEQIPNSIAIFITELSSNPLVILLIINILLLIVGMFIDTISALIVLSPILLPIVTAVGVDPVHFGVILVSNLAIGFITPPLGVNLFVASSISGIKIEKIIIGILPFLLSMIICLLVITYVPALSTWLPLMLD
ncbi:TRAP transporter large permease [Bacillus sp. DTU_2020_1000418_1_SI_GHA_SEK_038]|uniref:TRAP transporter large permease n=1 Tax=Bacillus sp. DTU_2020_1000418_1_SI_GHA_SEK_038 TaxID=3077585 RepID=UPI0028E35B2E|nr:TRAP transporter large permease [Bacillus sp. DTU_2020_1000418_1_SI_GHA_SEK_038]WNS76607.1 TRAP transporter large permease [Bacillus sp. DTU_2020_1000418_1_SI_GHA_SEK_038]